MSSRLYEHFCAKDFQQQPGAGCAFEAAEAIVENAGDPGNSLRVELLCLLQENFTPIRGGVDQPQVDSIGDGLEQHEVAQAVEEVFGEFSGRQAGLDDVIDRGEEAGTIVGGEGGDSGVDKRVVGNAEKHAGVLVGEAVGAGAGEKLVEDGERVAG